MKPHVVYVTIVTFFVISAIDASAASNGSDTVWSHKNSVYPTDDIEAVVECISQKKLQQSGKPDSQVGNFAKSLEKVLEDKFMNIEKKITSRMEEIQAQIMSTLMALVHEVSQLKAESSQQEYKLAEELKLIRLDITSEIVNIKKEVNHCADTTNSAEDIASKDEPARSNCADVYRAGIHQSGIYMMDTLEKQFEVYCEMESDGGGWTLIQRRDYYLNEIDFFQHWSDYREGFGNLSGEFWIGLEKIHWLTSKEPMSLQIKLEDFAGNVAIASYDRFHVASDKDMFVLDVTGFSGNATDSFSANSGMPFTTRDVDNDKLSVNNCAEDEQGAWWFSDCGYSNLNGPHNDGATVQRYGFKLIYWHTWKPRVPLRKTEMKIRPYGF